MWIENKNLAEAINSVLLYFTAAPLYRVIKQIKKAAAVEDF